MHRLSSPSRQNAAHPLGHERVRASTELRGSSPPRHRCLCHTGKKTKGFPSPSEAGFLQQALALATTHPEQKEQDSPTQQGGDNASHHQVPGAGFGVHLRLLPRHRVRLEAPLTADSWLLQAARGQKLQHTPGAG